MKSLRTLTLAATLALIGMAGGFAGGALAQTGDLVTPTGKPVVTQGLLLPAVQKMPEKSAAGASDGAADLVTGAGAGKPGEGNALIGLLRPGESSGHTAGTLPAVQFPTDQVNGDGRADLVTGAGGGQANGLTKVGPGTLTLSGQNTYAGQTTVNQGVLNQKGSLQRLGSIGDLFANSRGGDHAAGAHGAGGGGGAGKVVFQDLHATAKAGDGSVKPSDQFANPTNGGTHLPAVQKVRDAAARLPANTTGGGAAVGGGVAGGGQIAGGAKGLNIANSARK